MVLADTGRRAISVHARASSMLRRNGGGDPEIVKFLCAQLMRLGFFRMTVLIVQIASFIEGLTRKYECYSNSLCGLRRVK